MGRKRRVQPMIVLRIVGMEVGVFRKNGYELQEIELRFARPHSPRFAPRAHNRLSSFDADRSLQICWFLVKCSFTLYFISDRA